MLQIDHLGSALQSSGCISAHISNHSGLHGEGAADEAAIGTDEQVPQLVQESEAVRRDEARTVPGR